MLSGIPFAKQILKVSAPIPPSLQQPGVTYTQARSQIPVGNPASQVDPPELPPRYIGPIVHDYKYLGAYLNRRPK